MNLIKSWGQMNKKIFGLTSFLLIFAVFFSGYAYAGDFLLGSSSSFDVSIDRATINGKVIAESRTNLIPDANLFSVVVDFTTLATLEKAHVEVIQEEEKAAMLFQTQQALLIWQETRALRKL